MLTKKIEVVFKMQIQATQVPQLKAKSLMISLVPVGIGKPTVSFVESPIIEGTCTWENPIYETVKLIMETKTGRIRKKIYYLIVSTGSSKSGFLGEVSIDFADLAEATKPMSSTLPLQTSKSGAVLQVTVQKMTGDPDSRYTEDNEAPLAEPYENEDSNEVRIQPNELNGSSGDPESDHIDGKSRDFINEASNDTFDNFTNQIKVLERKVEVSEIEVQTLRQQIIKESNSGQQLSDQIICLKEERDALKDECEKLKISSHTENETENLGISLEAVKQELQREKNLNKELESQLHKSQISNSEFMLALADLIKELEQKNLEIARISSQNGDPGEAGMLKAKIEQLCSEIEFHKKEKEELQMEVEVVNLKYESLEAENGEFHSKLQENQKEKMEFLDTIQQFKFQVANLEDEIKGQEVQYLKSLDLIDHLEIKVEKLQKELENQAREFEQDLNGLTNAHIEQEHRAIRADEAFREIEKSNANATERLQEEFKQISADMSLQIEENQKIAQKAEKEAKDLRQKNESLEELLEKKKEKHRRILRELNEQKKGNVLESTVWIEEKEDLERELALVKNEAEMLKEKIEKLSSEIEFHKKEKEEFRTEVKGGNLKCESLEAEKREIHYKLQENQKEKAEFLDTIQQFRFQVANLEEEIKEQEVQSLKYLDLIDRLEIKVEKLQKELKNQAQEFEQDLNGLTNAQIEQEHRAIRAEEDLRKIEKSNANEAESLQAEFRKISADLSLQIEENQRIAQKAEKEAKDLRQKNEYLEGLLEKKKEEHGRILRELNEQKKGNVLESTVWIEEKEDLERELASTRNEAEMLKEKTEKLGSEIEFHKKEKEEFRMEVEGVKLKYESLGAEKREIHSKLQENQKEKMKIQHSCTEYVETIQQFKSRVAKLEEEIKGKEVQYLESLDLIDHLEIEGENLQKELENQAQELEQDLSALTNAKIEQERRAIRAEEALRKIEKSNANETERLQEKFKQVSADMSLQIEENQKIAQKAEKEAKDLRQKNESLAGLLKKKEEEHERILRELNEQKKGIVLEDKYIVLTEDKEDFERELALVRNEAEKLRQENASMKLLVDQKKSRGENLNLEVKKLRLKNNEVKNQAIELEMEKESLEKEMSKLREEFKQISADMSLQIEENQKTAQKAEKEANNLRQKNESLEGLIKKKEEEHEQYIRELNEQKKEIVLEDKSTVWIEEKEDLERELASLKELNKSTEECLKEMHERYSEISLKFAEVQGERQELVMALRNMKGGKKN